MTILEQYIDCMEQGDNAGLADLFADDGVLHDSSLIKIGKDTLHLEGKMAIEMMFHHKFGFNGGPFKIRGVKYRSESTVWYFITYGDQVMAVDANIEELDENGKIKRMNIHAV